MVCVRRLFWGGGVCPPGPECFLLLQAGGGGYRLSQDQTAVAGSAGVAPSTPASRIDGALLARNTILNLVGQVLPLGVAVVAMPMAMRGLGADAFGVLSLAWMLLGYFGIFDLGLGRATTKFVAEAISRGDRAHVSAIVSTSLVLQLGLGCLGGIVLAAVAPWLVNMVLKIPPDLVHDATVTFRLLALSAPVVLVTATFRGVLEAHQRFELVNAVKIPASALTYVWPAVAVPFGLQLPHVVVLLLLTRLIAMVIYFLLGRSYIIQAESPARGGLSVASVLLGYGGWVALSNVVGPVLVYLDRLLIGALVGVAAVGYYTAPYEMVTRITIIASSLVMTLFPVFSRASSSQTADALQSVYYRSLRYLFLVVGPVVTLCIVFGWDIMAAWVGRDVAERSTIVFQVLAVGVFANSMAQIPFGLLQGSGHPDWTAKLHSVEALLYGPLVWLLVGRFGLAGGAVAWTIRVTVDSAVLLVLSHCFLGRRRPAGFGLRRLAFGGVSLVFLALVLVAIKIASLPGYLSTIAAAGVALAAFAASAWFGALDGADRAVAVSALARTAALLRYREREAAAP